MVCPCPCGPSGTDKRYRMPSGRRRGRLRNLHRPLFGTCQLCIGQLRGRDVWGGNMRRGNLRRGNAWLLLRRQHVCRRPNARGTAMGLLPQRAHIQGHEETGRPSPTQVPIRPKRQGAAGGLPDRGLRGCCRRISRRHDRLGLRRLGRFRGRQGCCCGLLGALGRPTGLQRLLQTLIFQKRQGTAAPSVGLLFEALEHSAAFRLTQRTVDQQFKALLLIVTGIVKPTHDSTSAVLRAVNSVRKRLRARCSRASTALSLMPKCWANSW